MPDDLQLTTFANTNPPWSLPSLDANFETLSNAITYRGVSVTDPRFGAVGDGVTNDTTAFTAAIASLTNVRGGLLLVPPGIYILDSTFLLNVANKGISFIGAGSSEAGQTNAPTVLKWTGGASIMFDVGTDCRNVLFRDMDFENTGTVTTFVRSGYTDWVTLERVNMRPTVFPSTAAVVVGEGLNRSEHMIFRDVTIRGNAVGNVAVAWDRAQECQAFNLNIVNALVTVGIAGSMDVVNLYWQGAINTMVGETTAAIRILQCRGFTLDLHAETNDANPIMQIPGGSVACNGIHWRSGYVAGSATLSAKVVVVNDALAEVKASNVVVLQMKTAGFDFFTNTNRKSVTAENLSLNGAGTVRVTNDVTNFRGIDNKINGVRQTDVGGAYSGYIGTATDADTTPSVRGIGNLILSNTGATVITDFDEAEEGQLLDVLFTNGNSTLSRGGGHFYLDGSVDFTGADKQVLPLVRRNGIWWQRAKVSANG